MDYGFVQGSNTVNDNHGGRAAHDASGSGEGR